VPQILWAEKKNPKFPQVTCIVWTIEHRTAIVTIAHIENMNLFKIGQHVAPIHILIQFCKE
jgi:hypothetical protein